MPVILRDDGLKCFFYANEGHPREPAHIHIRRAGIEAKCWLTPMCNWHAMMASTRLACGASNAWLGNIENAF